MTNKRLVKGFLCCVILLARLLFLGALVLAPGRSGIAGELACEIDVASYPPGGYTLVQDVRDVEIPAVGYIVYRRPHRAPLGRLCTGTLLNDTANVHKYFLTAYHCLGNITAATAAPIANVYWNYQAATGGTHTAPGNPPLQVGAQFRAAWPDGDFLLWELNDDPKTIYADVHYAGWDARPLGTPMYPPLPAAPFIGIHKPGDGSGVKSISLSKSVPVSKGSCSVNQPINDSPKENWVASWDAGTTENGSSGSCLFGLFDNGTDGRCIGQLYGEGTTDSICPNGYSPSMCNPPNSNYSFYGKLSASWAGGMTPATSLKPWLDPSSAKFNDGDPHITTADGNHYNFQGAGEYVSLRNAGLEIQTRQAPVATTFNPEADPHDGLATCVSINTAVAARVGSHRVTYEPKLSSESDRHGFQPNPEGWPDQSGFQLRVDGHPITLGPAGLDLAGGGRIAPIGAPGDIEIDFPDHNALQVTLGQFEGKTDLFLQVSRLPVMGGTEGVAPESGLMGPIAKDSWLPALPDGTPVPMPPSYTGLYQTFGEAWRVKDKASSLFDYASGESPDAFSNPKWPPEIPPNWPPEKPRCLISGTTPLEPASEPVAQEACHQITGKNMLADCIFDVRVTGNTGFAKTYLAQQQLQFGATKTTVEDDKDVTKYGRIVTFTATVGSAVSRIRAVPTGTVQFKLDGRPVGSPVELKNGRAERSTSDPPQVDLPVGIHQIEASYIPSDDSLYLASVSPYESHVVLGPFNWYLWLAILLLIIVLILLVWWYLRTS